MITEQMYWEWSLDSGGRRAQVRIPKDITPSEWEELRAFLALMERTVSAVAEGNAAGAVSQEGRE